MKFKSFFITFLSLTTVLSLVDNHTASTQTTQNCCQINDKRCHSSHPKWGVCRCVGSNCPVYNIAGTTGSTWIPYGSLLETLEDQIAQNKATVGDYLLLGYVRAQQGNFTEAETLYSQALGLAETTKDLDGQAAAHQGLGGIYARIGNKAEAFNQLNSARSLYQRLVNSQHLDEVRVQLRQMQLQQR
jgi:tetratricopeptide (TPR) repeat protein